MKVTDIKIGETVRLESGGPIMTIVDKVDMGEGGVFVFCQWFDESRLEVSRFRYEALKLA